MQVLMPIVVVVLGLVATASAAVAGVVDEGARPYLCKEYAAALPFFRRAAEGGDSRAQTYLGEMYREARGVPKDVPQPATGLARRPIKGMRVRKFGSVLLNTSA